GEDDQRRDDHRPGDTEDRAAEQGVRLPGPAAEVAGEGAVRDVERSPAAEDAGRRRQREAGLVQREAEEDVGEARLEREPDRREVPDRLPLAERDDPLPARRVVVENRLLERLAVLLEWRARRPTPTPGLQHRILLSLAGICAISEVCGAPDIGP